MKSSLFRILVLLLSACSHAGAQASNFTNFIRQVQLPVGVQWDATVAANGQQLSSLAINPGGARFELWTVQASPLKSYLLDTRYVGTYVPLANVVIRSEDLASTVPRTRADRPFYVDITVSGLLDGEDVPDSSRKVKLLRHVQSYGIGGTGENLDRTQASLLSDAYLTENKTHTLSYTLNSVPAADRAKVRGEERFSVFSLEDYQAPETQISAQTIQIWPVADGSIVGLTNGQMVRIILPQVTLNLNDLYPSSTTYAQVYQGNPQLGVAGKIVPGSALVLNESVPQDRVLLLQNYSSVFDADGRWTMELLTVTPFGIDRLAYVSFDLDRTLRLNGTVTTQE